MNTPCLTSQRGPPPPSPPPPRPRPPAPAPGAAAELRNRARTAGGSSISLAPASLYAPLCRRGSCKAAGHSVCGQQQLHRPGIASAEHRNTCPAGSTLHDAPPCCCSASHRPPLCSHHPPCFQAIRPSPASLLLPSTTTTHTHRHHYQHRQAGRTCFDSLPAGRARPDVLPLGIAVLVLLVARHHNVVGCGRAEGVVVAMCGYRKGGPSPDTRGCLNSF